MKRLFTLVLAGALALTAFGQQDLINKLDNYFRTYSPSGQLIRSAAHLKSININDSLQTIEICADNHLGEQTFTPESAERIYESIQRLLPDYSVKWMMRRGFGATSTIKVIPGCVMPRSPIRYLMVCRTAISRSGPVMDAISASGRISGNGSDLHSSAVVKISSHRPSSYLI